jgi:hypothetical protein
VLLAPALVAALVYLPTLWNELTIDDPDLFGWLDSLESVAQLFTTGPLAEPGRGLTYLTVWAEQGLWGEWVPGYRITNILLHALCSSLAALTALVLTGRRWVALFCGLLFAVHPVHVEAVASIENRKDLLATAFALGSLLLYQGLRPSFWSYLGALACFVLALISKEVVGIALVVILPATALLRGSGAGKLARVSRYRVLGVVVLLVGLGLAVFVAIAGPTWKYFTPDSIRYETEGLCRDYSDVLEHMAGAAVDATRLLILPIRLTPDYEGPSQREVRAARAPLGALLALGLLLALVYFWRRSPVVAFALLWSVATYLPSSNLVPLTHFFVAERYLYAPSLGVCLIAAVLVDRMARVSAGPLRGRAWALGLAGLLVVGGTARSIARELEWRNSITLWSSAVAATPQASARAQFALGMALLEAGRPAEAIPHLENTARLRPDVAHVRRALARARAEASRR